MNKSILESNNELYRLRELTSIDTDAGSKIHEQFDVSWQSLVDTVPHNDDQLNHDSFVIEGPVII